MSFPETSISCLNAFPRSPLDWNSWQKRVAQERRVGLCLPLLSYQDYLDVMQTQFPDWSPKQTQSQDLNMDAIAALPQLQSLQTPPPWNIYQSVVAPYVKCGELPASALLAAAYTNFCARFDTAEATAFAEHPWLERPLSFRQWSTTVSAATKLPLPARRRARATLWKQTMQLRFGERWMKLCPGRYG